jgi:hypothetical protein
LTVLSDCIHVSGIVEEIRNETDGDLHILLKLDAAYTSLLTPANSKELGDLVVEPVCVKTPTQADAISPCSQDSNPLTVLPAVGDHVWMEGRYVLDKDHDGWAEIHPLARWGLYGKEAVNQPSLIIPVSGNTLVAYPTATLRLIPTSTPNNVRTRIGALCNDGTSSNATGSGACSHHGGVGCWKYNDGSCTKP